MKLRYIITAFVSALVFAGCQTEPMVGSFADFSVDKTFVSIPLEGGSVDVAITAAAQWGFTKHYDTGKKDDNKKAIYDYCPNWITLSALEGSGNATVTITATATESGREVELQLKSGDHLQHLIVRQGTVEAVQATCKEVMEGPDGKSFILKGKVTKIANTTYGNLYLDDGTYEGFSGGNADGVYVYGTLDKDGKSKNFLSLGIEVGDIITVSGPKTTYSGTVELVDVMVLEIEKALVKIVEVAPAEAPKDGADVKVTIAFKGKGVYAEVSEEASSWITYKKTEFKPGVATIFETNPADTAVVTLAVAANEMGAREGIVYFTSASDEKTSTTQSVSIAQEGSIAAVTCAEFNAKEDGSALFKVKGVISSIVMDSKDPTKYNKYGNFYINDDTGIVYVYGLLPESGGETGKDVLTTKGIKVGDIITVVGPKTSYNSAPQMKNAYYESHESVTTVTAEAFNALADGDALYQISGTVKDIVMDSKDPTKYNKYGNFYIEDATGSVYVYGLVPTLSGASGKDLLTTLGVKEGDAITVVGPKGSYNNAPQMKNAIFVSHVPANPGGEE